MKTEDAQKLAASVLASILTSHGINHAFIGGFAVRILGHRRETEDIDVELDILPGPEPRHELVQLLLDADPRFSVVNLKLFFTPSDTPDLHIPVETLPIGELNLP